MKNIDLKTLIYLYVTGAKIVEHEEVVNNLDKLDLDINNINMKEVYIFNSYEELKNYFLMYLDDISDEILNLVIYTRGLKGQIVAFKGLCETIIIRTKIEEFARRHTKDEIIDVIGYYLFNGYCPYVLDKDNFKNHCKFFNLKCSDCLTNYASHIIEDDKNKVYTK
jgi:hypothetical protein